MAERLYGTHTKLISVPQETYRFLANPGFEVMKLLFASDSVIWASLSYTVEKQAPILRHTNEVVAAHVACGDRMHFYAHLDNLGERAVYYDTDIFIFAQKNDEPTLKKCGDVLGDVTSELKGKDYISGFVSGGPKNYA